jgi:protein AroM
MMTIGFATIGQTPRDDLVPYLVGRLSTQVKVIEGGIMDHLSQTEIDELGDDSGELHMVTRLRDGGSARIAYKKALPRMQRVVDGLVADGANLIVILCGADWSAIKASVPVINPGRLFPNIVQALAGNSKLGVIKPSAGQVEYTVKQYRDTLGIDVSVTSAFPYDEHAKVAARNAALDLKQDDVGLVWMTCVGMDEAMKEVVQKELQRPTILARSILARVIDELVA